MTPSTLRSVASPPSSAGSRLAKLELLRELRAEKARRETEALKQVDVFRYAETVKDATRRQGGQFQKLTFDERNLTSPDVVTFLESRLRSGRADVPVVGIRSGTNPGGPGHGASKARYVDPTGYGEH